MLNRTLVLPQFWCWCDHDFHADQIEKCRIKCASCKGPCLGGAWFGEDARCLVLWSLACCCWRGFLGGQLRGDELLVSLCMLWSPHLSSASGPLQGVRPAAAFRVPRGPAAARSHPAPQGGRLAAPGIPVRPESELPLLTPAHTYAASCTDTALTCSAPLVLPQLPLEIRRSRAALDVIPAGEAAQRKKLTGRFSGVLWPGVTQEDLLAQAAPFDSAVVLEIRCGLPLCPDGAAPAAPPRPRIWRLPAWGLPARALNSGCACCPAAGT
jgi:hypothetical protein